MRAFTHRHGYARGEELNRLHAQVRELLHKRIRDTCLHPQFNSDVMKPLNIESLLDQEVSDLFMPLAIPARCIPASTHRTGQIQNFWASAVSFLCIRDACEIVWCTQAGPSMCCTHEAQDLAAHIRGDEMIMHWKYTPLSGLRQGNKLAQCTATA